jgi:hypothetical protein
MEYQENFMEPLIVRAEEYVRTSFELFKLKALNQTTKLLSTFISRSIFILSLSMFLIVATIGAALWLGDLLGKSYYGFFCVAGFYGIIGVVLYFFLHNSIKRRVSQSIISTMLN